MFCVETWEKLQHTEHLPQISWSLCDASAHGRGGHRFCVPNNAQLTAAGRDKSGQSDHCTGNGEAACTRETSQGGCFGRVPAAFWGWGHAEQQPKGGSGGAQQCWRQHARQPQQCPGCYRPAWHVWPAKCFCQQQSQPKNGCQGQAYWRASECLFRSALCRPWTSRSCMLMSPHALRSCWVIRIWVPCRMRNSSSCVEVSQE